MDVLSFPYAVVRYQRGRSSMPAMVVFYAVSWEQASHVLQGLIAVEHLYDPLAVYAVREAVECSAGCFASPLYSCPCR